MTRSPTAPARCPERAAASSLFAFACVGWRVALLALVLPCVACSGVYEEVAPAQKRVVEAVLVPDFIRGGEEGREVVAFIDVDPQNTYLSEFPVFGDGIFVTRTVTGEGCTTSSSAPAGFELADPLRICLELQVDAAVATGEREVVFELRSSGEAVIARASFFVLPPLR